MWSLIATLHPAVVTARVLTLSARRHGKSAPIHDRQQHAPAALIISGLLLLSALGLPTASAQHRPASPAPVYIGVEDGELPYMFGTITDLAVDTEGNVFVLDAMSHELRWFDAAGRYRGKAGGKGGGPGELNGPNALAVSADGRIHVLDPGNTRITTYRRTGTGLRHERDTRLPFLAIDLCVVGNRRFVLTQWQAQTIFELDTAGKVVNAFGKAETPTAEQTRLAGRSAALLRPVVNQGTLHCDDARGRIIQLHSSLRMVRAHAFDGRMLWRAALPGLEPARFEESKPRPGGLSMSFVSDLAGAVDAITDADGTVLVTVSRRPADATSLQYETWRLRSSDGRLLGRASAPARTAAVHGDRRYGYEILPYPRVVIFR